MAQTKNSTAVKSNRLFSGITGVDFNFKEKNYVELKEGDVVYSRGDKSEYMYLLISGRIKLKTYENPRQPKVYLVSKNEFFGEKELLDKTTRNSSAVAEKHTVLFKIGYKDFFKLYSSNRKIVENLQEKKYEEVVALTRKSELTEDIFKRILNEAEPVSRKKNGIELRDYSFENPLLEIKAKDEISDALKMYGEDDDENVINFDETDTLPDDEDFQIEEEESIQPEPIAGEQSEEPLENILDDFLKIQEQVNTFSDDLQLTEDFSDTNTLEYVTQKSKENIPDENFIAAVERLSSGIDKLETDKLIVEACSELASAESGILYYPDNNGILKGILNDEEAELTASEGSVPARCLMESKLINIKDVFDDPNFNPAVDYISYFHIHSMICIPVLAEGKIKAVLQLFNSRNGEFSETDEQMLTSITPVIYKSIERWERIRKRTEELKITDLALEEERRFSLLKEQDKQVSLKVLMDFLLQEFQVIIGDAKQFNAYLQRIDVPAEAKEISDVVTSQTTKVIDLLEALKTYSESRRRINDEIISYVTVFDEIVNLLAEYTEGRKVNLYKRFETEGSISVDPKYLYLAVFQLIKYQCDLMPFGGNIFISSLKNDTTIEVNIRNATKKTDESLAVPPIIEYTENTPRGLGLSLARRIIEDHNATLEIKSQSGTGLEVIICFPLAD
jgi:CRP-like cAMP-binding protein/signal transduction histidine kinase